MKATLVVPRFDRHFVTRSLFGFAAVVFLVLSMAPIDAAHANDRQYRALMARYFLQNHQAIPLNNNGNVKSGDVLKLPEEATYVPRSVCYDLGRVNYNTVKSEFIKTSFDIASEIGGGIPTHKIAEIEAELGGKLQTDTSIQLDPLSEEGPPKGYLLLQTPKPDPHCDIVRNILRGSAKDFILVTRVFHGQQSAEAGFTVSGNAGVTASVKEPKIKAILGGAPNVHLKISGSNGTLRISRTPDDQSLAVQSAFLSPREFARVYLQSHSNSAYDLEVLVEEYVTGTEPDVLAKIQLRLQIALKEMGLLFSSAKAMYSAAFSGDGAIPYERAIGDIPPNRWQAYAVVAAANEIAAEQPPR